MLSPSSRVSRLARGTPVARPRFLDHLRWGQGRSAVWWSPRAGPRAVLPRQPWCPRAATGSRSPRPDPTPEASPRLRSRTSRPLGCRHRRAPDGAASGEEGAARFDHAELVSAGVSQDHMPLVGVLTDIEVTTAELERLRHRPLLVVVAGAGQVKMHAVRSDPFSTTGSESEAELGGVAGQHHANSGLYDLPNEHGGPELRYTSRLVRVEGHGHQARGHGATIEVTRSTRPRCGGHRGRMSFTDFPSRPPYRTIPSARQHPPIDPFGYLLHGMQPALNSAEQPPSPRRRPWPPGAWALPARRRRRRRRVLW